MRWFQRVAAGVLIMSSLFAVALPAAPAFAADPVNVLDGACTGKAATDSAACNTDGTKNPLTGPDGILLKIARIIAIIAGFAAVLVIIISGARYMTAGGDTQKAVGARNALIGALIGLVIISLAGVIITFVVNRIYN